VITTDAILAGIAALMAYATAVLIKWASEAKTPVHASVVTFLLAMMVAMFAGALVYFVAPSRSSIIEGLWLGSALMSISVIPFFLTYLNEVKQRIAEGDRFTPRPIVHPYRFIAAVVALVLVNELLMGATFQLAAGSVLSGGLADVLTSVATSPWFLFTMSAEMALTTYFLRDRISAGLYRVLLLQSLIMFLSPTAFALGAWVAFSVYLSSATMIVLFIYLMEFIYRHRQLDAAFSHYVGALLGIYGLMMAGQFIWLYFGGWADIFALGIVAEMVVFFAAIVGLERFGSGLGTPWQLDANWTFGVLASIFVAEIFMGALLAVQIDPAHYAGAFFTLPLSGSAGTIAYHATYNGFWFLAGVTASTWFLTMMGIEMGALVFFKIRETPNLENRIRMVLMMSCYAVFAVFFPSIYYHAAFPNAPAQATVPVLGWSMGIGSAVLAASALTVVILTYAIMGTLTALFGRRVVCSTFCTAALMYQGTTLDAMKSFNRSGPVGRKYLGSRFSTAYSISTGVILGSLLLASTASYLDSTGVWNVKVLGADPTVFLFSISFGILWYVLFVAVPYVGTYNCVTMGWCYTGAISQAFHKIGLFKLKVRSKDVCKACTTLDCAKSCPIGLVNMPGSFRTKGEFRSSKCCGVGDCVGACPYGNMYIYDVRHWVRGKLGLPLPAPRGTKLPMAGASPPPSATTATRTALTPSPASSVRASPGGDPAPGL
jgi:polyferredoxin